MSDHWNTHETNYTWGCTTTGNIQALCMSVMSVLLGQSLPNQILIRFEGEFPCFDNFYLAQLAELARHKKVDFSLHVAKSQGVRFARDWLMRKTITPYLWMGDDDAIYAPYCLTEFAEAVRELVNNRRPEKWGYVVGNKPDLNNRRGYEDFSTTPIPSETAANHSSFNQFYEGESRTVLHEHLDTGNVVLNVHPLIRDGVSFNPFPKSFNSGGEDTLFALQCNQKGHQGYFRTRADAFHLEKPQVRFGEFAARKTALLRECELLGIPTHRIEGMMPWVK